MAISQRTPTRETSRPLEVCVCAEDATLRDRICDVLGIGGHAVTARVGTLDGLASLILEEAPACLVVATERPDRSAIGVARRARSEFNGACAVLVCRRARGLEIRRALELGVDGVVLMEELDDALSAVVSVVCAGQVSLPSAQRAEARAQALTRREKQILALVIAGMTNAQIAAQLFLAESTVKSHLSSAFGKLGVSSRHEAASLILDPERGSGLGIRGLPQPIPMEA
jgi:two-component system response regulator DesR